MNLFKSLFKQSPAIASKTTSKREGWAYIDVRDKDGNLKESRIVKNLITNAGLKGAADRLGGISAAAFTYLALGTGTTAAAAGNTALETELSTLGLSRVNATVAAVTTTVTDDTLQLSNTFTVTGTAAVTEAGILNAGSGGTLLSRLVFSAVNVINGDSLTVTYKIIHT
jgi:hypothetical protein